MPSKGSGIDLGLVEVEEVGVSASVDSMRILSEEDEGFCVMTFGAPGSGKSVLIAGLVELGFKPLVFHFGLGRHGLRAARDWYKHKTGKNDFYNHCKVVVVNTYDQAIELKQKKWKFIEGLAKNDKSLKQFLTTCDVIVIEEINGIQALIDEEIISDHELSPQASADDKDAVYSYWRNQKAGTERIVKGLLHIISPHRPLNYYLTCHDKSRDVKLQGVKQADLTAPAISGAALNAILGAPDYVIRTYYETPLSFGEDEGSKEFYYEFESGSGSSITKVRGLGWPKSCIANPIKLWQVIAKGESPEILKPGE